MLICFVYKTTKNAVYFQAECCGISAYNYVELLPYMISDFKIPIYCCKENRLTEIYKTTYLNWNCTKMNDTSLNHGRV